MAIDFTQYDYIANPYKGLVNMDELVVELYGGIILTDIDWARAEGLYVKADYYPAGRAYEIDVFPVHFGHTNIPRAGVQHEGHYV